MKFIKNRYPLPESILVIATCLYLIATFTACNPKGNNNTAEGKLKIVTTTGMIKDAVQNIVQDKADVAALMGAGVDPHLYKASQNDLNLLSNADMVFYNGLFLEGKMEDILEKLARQKPVFAVSAGIDNALFLTLTGKTATDDKHAYDPHIWFDVSLWAKAVTQISKHLQEKDPENAAFYRANEAAYLQQLASLHEEVKQQIAGIPKEQRLLITSHDAFNYFGRAYNIEVKGLQGISTVIEFGLKDITDMVELISSRKVKAVFVESSVPAKPLEAVVAGCNERGHRVSIGGTLFSDAMGQDGTPEGTYIGMVKANVHNIVQALK
ncbi:manganese transporter [Sphingobacteriales bacterium UPWRP_1]|nr:manganese transporter [Sphingobacteriales bacterium TSM_CSM]PSJ78499.1 manganese transporter [Sphingobacteriales bacterium UPWRP_1]